MKVFLVLSLVVAVAWSLPKPKSEIRSIIESVPAEDRIDFIKKHVKLGYDIVHGNTVASLADLPDSFSVGLYKMTVPKDLPLSDSDPEISTFELICFEDGTCVEIGDPGIHPGNTLSWNGVKD